MTTHFEWEQRNPRWAEHARQLDAGRRNHGMPSLREFPCLGALRIVGEVGGLLELCCDTCNFEVTVPKGEPDASRSGGEW